MLLIIIIFFFVLGLVIGSFLNVVINRLGTSRTFGGRSICMSCNSKIRWYDLLPFASFVFLLGRCRTCRSKISKMYPTVEFITGLIFVFLFLKFQSLFLLNMPIFLLTYVFYASAFSILIVIAFYDFRHKIIPDNLSVILGVLSFVGLFFFNTYGFYSHTPTLLETMSGILIALPFLFFWLVSRGEWMGLGDAKLAIGLGWLVGISRAISGVVMAFWIGAVLSVCLVVFSKKYRMKSQIPFAPFLVLGIILAFLFEVNIFPFF